VALNSIQARQLDAILIPLFNEKIRGKKKVGLFLNEVQTVLDIAACLHKMLLRFPNMLNYNKHTFEEKQNAVEKIHYLYEVTYFPTIF